VRSWNSSLEFAVVNVRSNPASVHVQKLTSTMITSGATR
jgi:hypothetical protein